MARLLMLSAGAGAGHNRAAEALDAAARDAGHESRWLDVLQTTNRIFRSMYADSYLWMAGEAPKLWGLLYEHMGKRIERPNFRKIVRAFDRAGYPKLRREVEAFAPDAVLCTHFLPASVVLAHDEGGGPPVFTVVTDFDVHSFWVTPGAAGYFAGNEQVRWLLRGFGVPERDVHLTGIPVHPAFAVRRGRDAVRREMGLHPRRPVVLFMSGGFGVGNMEEALGRLLALDLDVQWIVVAGKNEKLRARLEKAARGTGRDVRVLGFVTNVPDFLEAADLLISKSGGLTSSEALAREVPLLVYSPIPGQEERNADYLIEAGAAAKAPTVDLLDFKVRELLETPGRIDKMRRAASSLARPFAARDVVSRVLEFLSR